MCKSNRCLGTGTEFIQPIGVGYLYDRCNGKGSIAYIIQVHIRGITHFYQALGGIGKRQRPRLCSVIGSA